MAEKSKDDKKLIDDKEGDSKSKTKVSDTLSPKQGILTLKEQLQKLRFDHASGQLSDVSKLKKKRKEIARFLTKVNMQKVKANEN